MPFDLRPWLPEDVSDNQIIEGGGNLANNCVPASGAYIMKCLGYEDYPPQSWTDDEYGKGYRGYTDFRHEQTEIARHFPNPPPTDIANPADNLAHVAEAAANGWPCQVVFNSDASGNIIGRRGSFHCCVPVAYVDGLVWVWKTEKGLYDRLTVAQYVDATSGSNAGTTVRFMKALPGFGPPPPPPRSAESTLLLMA